MVFDDADQNGPDPAGELTSRPRPRSSRQVYWTRRGAVGLTVVALIVGIVVAATHRSPAASNAHGGPSTTAVGTPNGGSGDPSAVLGKPAPGQPLTTNIYSADGVGMLSPVAAAAKPLIYVPNSDAGTVDVIDPATLKVVDHFRVGRLPQHVVPAWDLKTLYVTNDLSNSLTPIDPVTGRRAGPDIPVDDPYNLYFTPDGAAAIVVAEAHQHLDFRDPHTFSLQQRVDLDCRGVDHIDFAADGSYLIATCEFSGRLVKVDLRTRTVVGYLTVGGEPQDIKVDPAGKVFYVADMSAGGLHEIDGDKFTKIGFLPTGPETHGLYVSRDARSLYVANRGGPHAHGSVSVVDFTSRSVIANWPVAHGTPDMGNVSADGRVLWLTGRRSSEVYAIDTRSGKLLARIPVGAGPHGLCVWPEPGRYSLGHTGILR